MCHVPNTPSSLGAPLPNAPHAVSVALPRWRHVVGYEEGDPAVTRRMSQGYPRFVLHPAVIACRDVLAAACGTDAAHTWLWPSRATADRCLAFLVRFGWRGRVVRMLASGVTVTEHFPLDIEAQPDPGKAFWQHSGEILSSRLAEAILQGLDTFGDKNEGHKEVRERVARLADVPVDCVFLYPTGMAAFYAVWRAIRRHRPRRPTIQFGFPYVDSLRIQQCFGDGLHFLPQGDEADHQKLGQLLLRAAPGAVFTEVPSNPLLRTPRLQDVASGCRAFGVPLVVDNTLDSFANLDLLPYADALVCSLTKTFAGRGDVMGGAVVLSPQSPQYAALNAHLHQDQAPGLWRDDARVLAEVSRDVVQRHEMMNRSATAVAAWLRLHPAVARVHFPRYTDRENFEALRGNGLRGWGALLSVELRAGARGASLVYDGLNMAKGPSLGTNFSLACPYTLLAHYHERDWAADCGVPDHLLRLSIGLEPSQGLIEDLEQALARAAGLPSIQGHRVGARLPHP